MANFDEMLSTMAPHLVSQKGCEATIIPPNDLKKGFENQAMLTSRIGF